MPRRITIAEVAKMAGVSIGAVSRIANGDKTLNVREDTRELVLKIIKEVGYSPNPQAQALRKLKSKSIAMIVPEIESPAFPAIIQGAQRAATEGGYSLLIGGIGETAEDPKLPERLVKANRVDGLLISTGRNEAAVLNELRHVQVPYVMVNRYHEEDTPRVVLDDFNAAVDLVSHLIDEGHRRIGFLGSRDRFLGTRRFLGYQKALSSAAIDYDEGLYFDAGYLQAGGMEGAAYLFSMENRPTAVFATNHLVAAGAVVVAKSLGLSVPEQVAVASFYDSPTAEIISPQLTAVRFPLEDLGFQALHLLLGLVHGTASDRIITIPHQGVVIRSSTVPARTGLRHL